MGSDRARVSYDANRQYRSVVMQQGRVTVEADWNEAWQIADAENIDELIDIIGPAGTPDDGYRIDVAQKVNKPSKPFDFSLKQGTMYVGGVRVARPTTILYTDQQGQEWLDHLKDPDWVDPSSLIDHAPKYEFIYLALHEQEVSAVEDQVLREVALGGPDTAQRQRIVQRVVRVTTPENDCEAAFALLKRTWATQDGLDLDDSTMRIMPSGTLQVNFQVTGTNDPCEPAALGGYLGADNQLIRVQLVSYDTQNKSGTLVWGYDDASFLYRVKALDAMTLQLLERPVDDFHRPRANQAVEVLRSAVQLDAQSDLVASATGTVDTLTSPYVPETQRITLPSALGSEYLDATQTPQLFLRVWEQVVPFTPGTAVSLGDTGVQVTLQATNSEPLHDGAFWMFAVRPDTPTEIYPHRYLESPQPPDGPRLWACPLAVIEWDQDTIKNITDCRNPFDNLVNLTRRSGGCCDVSVRPQDITEQHTLQNVIDRYKNKELVTICLKPGTYNLFQPLLLGPEHSNLTLEGCHDGAVLQAAVGHEAAFQDGLIILNRANNVTLRGLRFELPLVPLSEGQITRLVGTQLQNLQVSIGIRPLHCALLTISNCLFRFALAQGQNVFGVGIFAASECWRLTVHNNRFVREEDYLRMHGAPYRLLIGYLLTPTTIFGSVKRNAAVAVPPGTLVSPLLQDASFQENLFSGLSLAVLIYSDAGVVKFERNTVRNCHAGFWLLSLRSLAFASFLDEVMVNRNQQAFAQQLRNSILSVVLDPIIQIGSVLARGYPLPKAFDVSHAVKLEGQTVSPTAAQERQQMQRLFEKALTFFRESAQSTTTTATEKVNILAETPPASAAPAPAKESTPKPGEAETTSTKDAKPEDTTPPPTAKEPVTPESSPTPAKEAAPPPAEAKLAEAPPAKEAAPPPAEAKLAEAPPAKEATAHSQTAAASSKKAAPSQAASTLPKELAAFANQQSHLASFERAAFLQRESKRGLRFSVHIADNDIDATVSSVTSGIALLVWDDERDTESMMTLSSNKIRNWLQPILTSTDQSFTYLVTVLVMMIERCTITGNLIINERHVVNAPGGSLNLVPGKVAEESEIAVTGNILRGQSNLRQLTRPGILAPLDTWQYFNTELP